MLYGGKHCIMIDKDKTNIIITENIGNIKSFQVYILIMKKQGIDKEKQKINLIIERKEKLFLKIILVCFHFT